MCILLPLPLLHVFFFWHVCKYFPPLPPSHAVSGRHKSSFCDEHVLCQIEA